MWVFGYGSLIWKVDFPVEKHITIMRGSHDHRGTADKPGRVVTLIPHDQLGHFNDQHDDELTWGVAYKVAEAEVEAVRQHLDHREKNGYTVHKVHIYHPEYDHPVVEDALVYIGTSENEAFLGPADAEIIAKQILSSIGPSGPNIDYLLNLCQALRDLHPTALDSHMIELEQCVVKALAKSADATSHSALEAPGSASTKAAP
ncbi:hypothetical protein H4R34_004785 [Dimargaris verticillata]|uniref:glutathione-specific gamma-glutamylcyclotransferase n=1 Tax=Dimargaris verticillata TaxID=2761393 RepID=A0A9W8B1W1_9FUNG|nr:hypothetical protein H4R34_004785 [Dimargaris verticillata]